MGGFNPPVPQQDSNWEIRAAVLLSLFFQVLLILLGPTRKHSSAPFLRLTVWSCYLLADWVADLALGLLLNNMGNIGGGSFSSSSFGLKGATSGNNASNGSSSSPVIFAFWTPFLLLHLGGPDTITAFSVEDNDLWLRHLIGLLFELFSACVIIFCSLRGNPLAVATMLMLVAGVIKYGERTYSLYSSSAERLRDNILGRPEPNYYRAAKSLEDRAYRLFLIFRRLFVDVIISSKDRRLSQAYFLGDTDQETRRRSSYDDYEIREAFEVMEVELNFMYDMVYTKAPVAYTVHGWVLRCICSCCLVSALLIFFFLDKSQILPVDVGITYALLLGGLALDATALLMIFFSNRAKVYLEKSRRLRWLATLREATKRWQTRRWLGKTSQLNLISHSLGKPDKFGKGAALCLWFNRRVARCLRIEDIVDEFVFIRRVRLKKDKEEDRYGRLRRFFQDKLVPKCCRKEEDIVAESLLFGFIFRGLKDALQKLKKEQEEKKAAADGAGSATQNEDNKEKDALQEKDAIAEVCRRRGDGVIKSHKDDIKCKETTTTTEPGHGGEDRYKVILDSVVKSDFDESLLLWHIATDLCLLRHYQGPLLEKTSQMRAIGECLSEYMLYLLIKQPEMLSARTDLWLQMRYRDTCEEARSFSRAAWSPNHEDARWTLLRVNTSAPVMSSGESKSVLFDAVILAKALRELDEVLMWDVITGVWGEMLTFAAVSGRGRTHMRRLNRGGELITFVWLLMQHMGLSDMYEIQGKAHTRLIVHY